MTQPLSLLPTCTVFIDGVRMADGGTPGEVDTDPVVLTDLVVRWGRENSLDQPEPGTCTFEVLDITGGVRFADKLHIGAKVDVHAEATIYPDPTVSTITDPGFEAATIGAIPPSVVTNTTAVVTTERAHTGTKSVRLDPLAGQRVTGVVFPPAPFGGVSAWDAIPRTLPGQTWKFGASVWLGQALAAVQVARVRPVAFTLPRADAWTILQEEARTLPGVTGWQVLLGALVPPEGVWLGVAVDWLPVGPAWEEVPPAVTWDSFNSGAAPLTNLATNPGYEVGTNSILSNSPANYVLTADTAAPIAGTRSALFTRVVGVVSGTIASLAVTSAAGTGKIPVTAGQSITGAASIKTGVPNATIATRWYWYDASNVLTAGPSTNRVTGAVAGIVYRVMETGIPPAGTVTAWFIINVFTASGNAVAGQKVWVDQITIENGTTSGAYFDGGTPDAGGIDYAWTGAANASTSTATDTRPSSPVWLDVGASFVDDLVVLAPAAGALRAGTVFSGRITDLEARYDPGAGGTIVTVTAQTHLAELNNRYVGAAPWGAESLGTRFGRIVTASGQPVDYQIDTTVVNKQITYRDVDNQPSGVLLHELAQSVGGALWSASSITAGTFLWLEDIDQRPTMFILAMGVDGLVHIVLEPAVTDEIVTIDACDVLLDPVRWEQTTEDDATMVVVSWQDQTVDPGPPAVVKPTTRDVTADNPAAEAATGRRRIQITTQLAAQADATIVANSVLGRVTAAADPWRVKGLVWRMDAEDHIDADTLGRVMTILDGVTRLGLGIRLTNLPEWSPTPAGTDVPLFLEGATFRNTDGAWVLELLTSSALAQGSSDVAWDQLPVDWAWNEFDPLISWSDLAGVGI